MKNYKNICLINIFGKAGGKFDGDFATYYIASTTSFKSKAIASAIDKLEKSLRHEWLDESLFFPLLLLISESLEMF